MPIYAYQCKSCGTQAEYIQKFSDDPKTECEHCGGPLEKLMSAPAFHLKGGGWYADGYASAGGGKSDGSSKPEAPKSDTAKSDSSTASPSKDSGSPSKPSKPSKSSATGSD